MSDIAKYERRLAREKTARQEAEHLLESKSAELYEKNLELFSLSESLEKLVAQRTAQMQKARDEALAALKIKTDFIANMSHELRTPMNGVLGVIGLLQNESLNQEQKELLNVAESSGKHLLEVINDILDFTKIEADKISIELSPVEIRPYLQNIIAPFSLQAQQKGIELQLHIDADVDQALITDKLRLTQIITNLLSNAIKFTHEGEVNLSMQKTAAESYRITATDTGIGISQENLKAVFAAFEQADTSITREFGGTGLGMNITKRLVDMMDGQISVESELGVGTRFCVDIKMSSAQIDKKETSVKADFSSEHNQYHLLLVEDHKVNQMVAQKLLESWGFAVTIAENGQEAIDTVKKNAFDAILMDLQMPIMGGIEATKHIRQHDIIDASIPIIAMTAHSSPEHVKECFEVGMQAHVSKPLERELLLNILQDQLTTNIQEIENESEVLDIKLVHIDIESSLQRLGGDWPMLHALITRFLEEFSDFAQLFDEAVNNDDKNTAKTLLHKIKGSGGNLGMTELSALANQAEQILAEKTQWPPSDLIDNIQSLLNKIDAEFTKVPLPNENDSTKVKIQVDQRDIVAQITLVQDSLNQDVFAAEDALKTLAQYELDNDLQSLLNDAHEAMQAFEIDKVSDALSKARSMME
jgi:signal transduction histidine kinase/CheY-like chemotaxis protein/HPt (histidine-containing phosphotransfer) domain-containing protein